MIQSITPTFYLCDKLLQESWAEIIKILDYINEDGTHTLYLAVLFYVEFIQQMHEEFSYLSYPDLLEMIQP